MPCETVSIAHHACSTTTYRSGDTLLNSLELAVLVCILKLAVSTNWPTVAPKPERKALRG